MKVAPVMVALDSRLTCSQRLVHTGQHYDANMSDVFFQQLGLPQPNVSLEVGSGSHAVQTAQTMIRFDCTCQHGAPDYR
jgi:UDP-N-acetylglucosamine 2-epimerase (non-hydrolysing)